MTLWLVLPIVLPLTAAATGFVVPRTPTLQRTIGLIGGVGHCAAGIGLLQAVYARGILVAQVGGWAAPFGITLVADLLSAMMVLMTGLMGLAAIVYSLGSAGEARERFGYYPLLQILLMGVSGAFLTGDLFNLFVWFEVMLIASFVLMVLGGERPQMEGAMKYVTLNLVSSALFLTALGVLYGVVGTLNMADVAVKLRDTSDPGFVTTLAMLFVTAFGIKAAAFPLFFWLPASYHTLPAAVAALFAGLLTKVGVYALFRVMTLVFLQDVGYTHSIILVVAGLTMVTGVLGAIAQRELRRLLSFDIISQIGYLLMGLGLLTHAALAGAIFFMIHVIVTKSMLFLVSGLILRRAGTDDLRDLGGFHPLHWTLGILYLVPALSLAGVPPFSGFFAKLALIQAGLEVDGYLIVSVAVGVSLLTLFLMMKIWAEVFLKPSRLQDKKAPPAGTARSDAMSARPPHTAWVPVTALGILIVGLGIAAEPCLRLAQNAAEQLMDPDRYVAAVLGEDR